MTKKRYSELLEKAPRLIPHVLLMAFVIAAYGNLMYGYFAADEWWAFSAVIASKSFWEMLWSSYAPGGNLFIYVLYHLFGVNAVVWAFLSIALHLLNVWLAYWFVTRLAKNIWVGFFAAALFAFLPMGNQFISHFSLMPLGVIGTTFALASLVAYSFRRPILSGFLFLISLSFTAYTGPFILLLVLQEFVLFEREKWRRSLMAIASPIVVFLAYLLFLKRYTAGLYDRPTVGEGSSLFEHLWAMITKSYQGYAELVIQQPGLIQPELMIRYSTILVLISLVLIAGLFLKKQYEPARVAIYGLLWIPSSLILFSTLNTVAANVTFPSRYFYVTTLGYGILIGGLVAGYFSFFKGRAREVVIGILVIAASIYYIPQTRYQVAIEVNTGKAKRLIMDTIVAEVPKPLGRQALFCFTSNTGHFATGPEVIPLPYAINFNFPLAVTYRANESTLRSLFTRSDYFVNPAASWYHYGHPENKPHEIGVGIGFATSLGDCQKVRSLFPFLKVEETYGFAYDGTRHALTNVTEPLRLYLNGDQSKKDALYPW